MRRLRRAPARWSGNGFPEAVNVDTIVWSLIAIAGVMVFVFAVPLVGIPILLAVIVGSVIGGTLIFLRRKS